MKQITYKYRNNLNAMKALLSVLDTEYIEEVNIEEIVKDKKLFKSAVRLAERNGLYYYFISRLRELNLDLPFLDEERWERENERLEEFKESIKVLNKASSEYGIDYILIKACDTIPHVSRDVDIFIRERNRVKIIDALKSYGMEYIDTSVTETILRKEGYIDIELYSRICYLGIDFIDEDFLFQSRITDTTFGIEYPNLNKEANLLLTIIHALLGHRRISLLDFLHIMNLRKKVNIDICRQYAQRKSWESVFNLTLDKLDTLHEGIYKEGEIINFPYLFDRNFMMRCIFELGDLNTRKLKMIFYISLIQDEIVEKSKNSCLYDVVKSHKSIEKFVTSFMNFINFKKMRGDMHR